MNSTTTDNLHLGGDSNNATCAKALRNRECIPLTPETPAEKKIIAIVGASMAVGILLFAIIVQYIRYRRAKKKSMDEENRIEGKRVRGAQYPLQDVHGSGGAVHLSDRGECNYCKGRRDGQSC